MSKISLSYYTFRITNNCIIDPRTKCPQYIALGDVCNRGLEEHIYKHFLSTAHNYINDKQNERLFRTIELNSNRYLVNGQLYYKSITAIVKTGEYGTEAEIVDSEDTTKTKVMSSSEAPVMPFGFAIYFNPSKDTAILITQSLGRSSIFSVLKKHLCNMVKSINSDLCAEIKNVVPHNLLKKLLDHDVIKSIRIETYKEKAYALEDEYGKTTTLQTSNRTSIYKRPLISNKSFLYDIFTGRRDISKIAGLTSDDEIIENIVVEFSNKCLNYNAYFSTRITEDISKFFEDEKGVPSFKLFEVMDKNVVEYLFNTKIIIPVDDSKTVKETTDYFYIDKERNDVVERNIIKSNN